MVFVILAVDEINHRSGNLICRYYSATIIRMSGVSDTCQAIWLASITAFTNFIFTFIGIAAVERLGRRILFLASLAGKRSVAGEYCSLILPYF